MILKEEMEGIEKIPGASITKDYIDVVAKRTGAEPAALWGLFKKIKYQKSRKTFSPVSTVSRSARADTPQTAVDSCRHFGVCVWRGSGVVPLGM